MVGFEAESCTEQVRRMSRRPTTSSCAKEDVAFALVSRPGVLFFSYRDRITITKTQAHKQGLIVASVVLRLKTVEAEKSSYTNEVGDGGFPTAGGVAVCK